MKGVWGQQGQSNGFISGTVRYTRETYRGCHTGAAGISRWGLEDKKCNPCVRGCRQWQSLEKTKGESGGREWSRKSSHYSGRMGDATILAAIGASPLVIQ